MAAATPVHSAAAGRVRCTAAASTGTITIDRPVKKADFDGVVYLSPNVCRAYPANRKKPAYTPARTSGLPAANFEGSGLKTAPKMTVATAKRNARNTRTEASFSASFTTTNVEPQMNALPISASSALHFRRTSSA